MEDNPTLHFELLAAACEQLLTVGKSLEALTLIRSQLTPLSSKHPQLQPKLKVSLPFRLVMHDYITQPNHCLSGDHCLSCGFFVDTLPP